MKFSLSLLVALFSVSVFGFVSDWNGYTLSPDYGALKTPAGKYAGGCSVIPAKKRDLVKIEVKDGKLVIDTRKFFGTDPKEERCSECAVRNVYRGTRCSERQG